MLRGATKILHLGAIPNMPPNAPQLSRLSCATEHILPVPDGCVVGGVKHALCQISPWQAVAGFCFELWGYLCVNASAPASANAKVMHVYVLLRTQPARTQASGRLYCYSRRA